MIEDLTGRSFYGNTVLDYIIFSGAVLTGLALVTVLRKVLMPRIRTWAQQTESSLDDILVRILERAVVLFCTTVVMEKGSVSRPPKRDIRYGLTVI